MNEQEKIQKCVMIPAIISGIPDKKMRFHFCEIFAIFSSPSMMEKYGSDAARLKASIEIVKNRLSKESLGAEESAFFETLRQQARQEVLGEVVSSEMLAPLVNKAVKEVSVNNDERIDALALRLHDLTKDVDDLSSGIDELKTLITGNTKSRETTSGQEGIVLVPDAGIEPPKIPKIDPKHMHLKDFIRKNRSEKDVQ